MGGKSIKDILWNSYTYINIYLTKGFNSILENILKAKKAFLNKII